MVDCPKLHYISFILQVSGTGPYHVAQSSLPDKVALCVSGCQLVFRHPLLCILLFCHIKGTFLKCLVM